MNRPMSYRPDHEDARRRAAPLTAFLTCLIVGPGLFAYAEDNPTESDITTDRRQLLSVLDGQAFNGETGELDEPAFGDDVWIFEEGMFSSKACGDCGKGEYWLRPENSAIRFRAETDCPDSGAALVYTGLVKDDRIEGTFTWTKDRWYGDIEKKFWFEGERVENAELTAPESGSSIDSCSEFLRRPASEPKQVPSRIRDTILRFP